MIARNCEVEKTSETIASSSEVFEVNMTER
jgi:hypothetical protein